MKLKLNFDSLAFEQQNPSAVPPTDLTVSAVVENAGQFLTIEERVSGVLVINQPSGHIEAGESPEQAVEREALEESGCTVSVKELLGIYLWIHPSTRRQFLRLAYIADLVDIDCKRELDDGVCAVHWYTLDDIRRRINDLRTPMVMRTIEDYLAGNRQSKSMLADLMPIQMNVQQVLANAALV